MGDVYHRLHFGGHAAEGAARDQAERPAYRGERRAQLMADGRNEFILQPLDLLAVRYVGVSGDRRSVRHALARDLEGTAVGARSHLDIRGLAQSLGPPL